MIHYRSLFDELVQVLVTVDGKKWRSGQGKEKRKAYGSRLGDLSHSAQAQESVDLAEKAVGESHVNHCFAKHTGGTMSHSVAQRAADHIAESAVQATRATCAVAAVPGCRGTS